MNFESFVCPAIAGLDPYKPGVYYTALAQRLGLDPSDIVKLDANENVYGPSPRALEALRTLSDLHIYPELQSQRLRDALADFTGVPADLLLAGAGSDELLALTTRLLLQPGATVVNCPPTFGMYAFFANLAGARVLSVPRLADFSLDLDAIKATVTKERPKLLFICAPNNPDGGWVNDEVLEQLLALPVLVLLDEAYIEFAGSASRIQKVPQYDNLIVLRTFSKWGGLAGLRIGYGAFPEALLPHLWKIKEPYTVSQAATVAALATLDDIDYLQQNRDRIVAERQRLITLLETIPYMQPFPSQANFILCRIVGRDPQTVRVVLEQEGILLRFYTRPGMDDLVRIAIGRPEQTGKLIDVLKRCIALS